MNKIALTLRKKKYRILFFLLPSILFLDQWTKSLVYKSIHLGESIVMIPDFFNLTYVQNKGAAFGLLSSAPAYFRVPFFIIVPLLALLSIIHLFRQVPEYQNRAPIALSLVIAGAIGNLLDRLNFGFVIDFLDFHWRWTYHYPSFNIADSAICFGVGLLMIDIFVSHEKKIKNLKEKEN